MNSAQPQKHNIYRNLILWQTHGVVNIIFTFKGVDCLAPKTGLHVPTRQI